MHRQPGGAGCGNRAALGARRGLWGRGQSLRLPGREQRGRNALPQKAPARRWIHELHADLSEQAAAEAVFRGVSLRVRSGFRIHAHRPECCSASLPPEGPLDNGWTQPVATCPPER